LPPAGGGGTQGGRGHGGGVAAPGSGEERDRRRRRTGVGAGQLRVARERRPVWLPSPGRPSAACVGRARRFRPRRTASTTAARTPARARLGSHLSALARFAKPVGALAGC